jgi:puromycin-sensitive aminopeptidase
MAHPTQSRNFRLDPSVRPVRYAATLSVDVEGRRFSGALQLDLALPRSSAELVLHAAGIAVGVARAAAAGGPPLDAREIRAVPESETVVLSFPAPLPAGEVTLHLEWTGELNPGLRGLYLGGPGIAVTQFEAADARRCFPCLDEPGFKAPWRLAVEGPRGAAILSNAAPEREEDLGARRRVHFGETPPLPTYLVALAVGPVDAHPALAVRGVPVRTWAQPEKLGLTGFGQDVAVEVLPRLEDYFGVPYAFGKLDQLGVPEFEAGAMENAGLVTYREVALLLDPATASLAQKKRVAEVVTHELAHQWFGNWVTMTWWDDLWLNEAFATWMAYKIVDRWKPDWRVWLDFDAGKAAAMHLDALRSTHPVRADVNNAAEATEAFDLITYEKGGAVLRMIEAWLGEARFREGIRLYMRRHARGNAVADDLWGALSEASHEPVVKVANAWIRAPGFPVVALSRAGRRVTLAQRRFFSDPAAGADPAAAWPVPIVLRGGGPGGSFEERLLLEGERAEVELSREADWLFGNAGATGFYRVAHDGPALAALAANLPALAPSERIALLSDEWALVRAGAREVGPFLDLAASSGGETDHAVLDELVARLAVVDHRLVPEAERPRLQAFVAALFAPQLAATTWDPAPGEKDPERLRRAAAVRALALLARDPGAVAEARARLDRWLAGDRDALEPNLHDAAVTAAARGGDAALYARFEALHAKEPEPALRRRWLLALAAFEDPALSARAVAFALSPALPLAESSSFVAALLANRAAREPFWGALRAAWAPLAARMAGAPMLLRRTVEALGQLVERRHLDEVRAFLGATPLEEVKQAVAQTLERLEQDVTLRERAAAAVAAWLRARR